MTDIKKEGDLKGYDAVVFGSPTYHGEMVQGMKTLLFMAEKAELEGKVGGAFGAFGWSGEAPDRIFETMKNIFKMKMVSIPFAAQIGHPGRRPEDGTGTMVGRLPKNWPENIIPHRFKHQPKQEKRRLLCQHPNTAPAMRPSKT